MRINQPVTNQAYHLSEAATLMSTTDTKGIIRYANTDFVAPAVSHSKNCGVSPIIWCAIRICHLPHSPICGQPYNGEPWTALVKNRRKNGDYYWVRANAVPVIRNGVHQGYMSVRTKPGDKNTAAEKLYADMRSGQRYRLAPAQRHSGQNWSESLAVRIPYCQITDSPAPEYRCRLATDGTDFAGILRI
jgi:aerotaxis receptor